MLFLYCGWQTGTIIAYRCMRPICCGSNPQREQSDSATLTVDDFVFFAHNHFAGAGRAAARRLRRLDME
jgi:hypothetical protein